MTARAAAIARRALRLRPALAFAAGAALTLAQPPYGLWPALFLGWPALARLAAAASGPRAAAGIGFTGGFGFFLTGLYWVGEAFLVEAAKVWWYAPLMPLAVALLAAVCASFWAVAFAAARALGADGWRMAVALAAATTVAELARGKLLTGFPWALQAYAFIDTPVFQAAALTGSFALSGVVIAAAAAAGWATPRTPWPAVAAVALLAVGWGAGAARLAGAPAAADGPPIRLVQPSTRQVDKWAPENRGPILRNLLELTASPYADAPPALVVWPEVAVTFLFDESPVAIDAAVSAAPAGAALAVGSVRRDGEGRLFNRRLFFDADGAATAAYDKARLTPFGEYVPYIWILGRIGLGTLGDGLSGFAAGDGPGRIAFPGLPPAAPLICYEIIFPAAVGEAAEGAGWILQVTNDAWFGDSGGPWQHLAQARARAVEQGLPVARAANTGVSAMIDGYGRVRAALGLGEAGVLDSPLPAASASATLYARYGGGPALALFGIGCIAALRKGRRAPR